MKTKAFAATLIPYLRPDNVWGSISVLTSSFHWFGFSLASKSGHNFKVSKATESKQEITEIGTFPLQSKRNIFC